MKKRLICFAFAALTITCMVGQRMPANLQKLLNAEYAINALYVDSVDEKKLVEDAIVGMLEKLDPHSAFTTAKETKELEEPLQGEFSGIGIQYNMKQDTLYVIQTIVNGPSERVGILPGDRIIFVNDTTIASVKLKNTDIQKKLRGKKRHKGDCEGEARLKSRVDYLRNHSRSYSIAQRRCKLHARQQNRLCEDFKFRRKNLQGNDGRAEKVEKGRHEAVDY